MILVEDTLLIGVITRGRGTGGDVQCLLSGSVWERADKAEFVLLNLQNILVPFRVEDWWYKNNETVVFHLKGIDSERQSTPLLGAQVRVLKTDVTAVEGEDTLLTWQDFVGYSIADADDNDAGTIVSVDETTANILALTDKGLYFPLHEDLIALLDTENRHIKINMTGV